MSSVTANADTFVGWLAAIGICAWALSNRIVVVLAWIDRRNAETDAQIAADHGEPTRTQVEWELHVADAVRVVQEDALARRSCDELEFAASVLADIDELPEVAR